MKSARLLAVGMLTVGFLSTAMGSPATAAGSCTASLTLDNGTCSAPVAATLTTSQVQQRQDKAAQIEAVRASLNGTSSGGGGITTLTTDPGGGGGTNFKLSSVVNMDIKMEGEGNGKKSYTCGPSATRNMVSAMYKQNTGAYHDVAEATYATWEGTTTAGTSRANVAAALNAHFGSMGSWVTSRPSDKASLLSTVIVDTKLYGQSVITNVDTEYLDFYANNNGVGNHALDHFNFVYGYDTTDDATRYLYVADEWNPVYIYGSASYQNPYGRHKEVLSHVFTAVDHTSIHGIVA